MHHVQQKHKLHHYCSACGCHDLIGRVAYASHSFIFIIEKGTSYSCAMSSFILMSICSLWVSDVAMFPVNLFSEFETNKQTSKQTNKYHFHYVCTLPQHNHGEHCSQQNSTVRLLHLLVCLLFMMKHKTIMKEVTMTVDTPLTVNPVK